VSTRGMRYRIVVAAATVLVISAPWASAAPRFREVGRALGLPRHTHSWSIGTGPVNAGKAPDLVLSTHAAVVVYRVGRGSLHRMLYRAGDDPHGCAIADVDANGLGDIYCARGADLGTVRKRNHLWLQPRAGDFVERAGAWGVTDPYGRGRHVAFFELDGDGRPDLFVGNEHPRANGRRSPNRTFVNVGGARYRQVWLGATAEVGARCAQAADHDGDGWDDLLVCGQRRLYLYRNVRDRQGDRRLVDVARRLGIDQGGVVHAWLGELNGDGHADLVSVRPWRLQVRPGRGDGTFRRPVVDLGVRAASSVAVGDLDGRGGPDIVLVRGCAGGRNLADEVFLARAGWGFGRVRLPGRPSGCGDVAAAIDIDRDGADEVVIMNGARDGGRGPIQVFTTGGAWR